MALYLAESVIKGDFQRDITHKNKYLPSISDLETLTFFDERSHRNGSVVGWICKGHS